MDGQVPRELQADPAAVDAALVASQCVISLGSEAGELTAAQCRALGMLASRSQWRRADLAGALGAAPSSAGRMCDLLARKGMLRTRRASRDRSAVLLSVTAASRKAAGEVPGAQWRGLAAGGAPGPGPRPPARPGGPDPQDSPARARAQERP
jgi:DNA-binding MarR family transcriptional regulator